MRKFILLLSISINAPGIVGQNISADQIKSHITTLAADEYEGRGTGLAGGDKAAIYIEEQFKRLKLSPRGDGGAFQQAFPFKGGVHGAGAEGKSQNVIGYLDNGSFTTIVIGAHYDHLGLGNDGSSLDPNPAGKIHNGADDNASGVAGIIELARYFTGNKVKESHNILFIAFSGEELGLFGSKYFTEHPTVDLLSINYMVNLDMVGRLDEAKGLSVSGSGTTSVWEPLLKKLSTEKLIIKTDSSGTGPSDHTSFYLKNIPVLHFFTGSHTDYHKPSDDWEKINFPGEAAVLELIIGLVMDPGTQARLSFLPTKNKTLTARSSFKVTLGIMPSYTSDGVGLAIDGVSEGKPAQKAGLLTGDIIIQLGDFAIKDIQAYMDALGKFEKGQTVPVKVKRKGEELTLSVTF